MEHRTRAGALGAGLDLVSGTALAYSEKAWLWIPFAIGVGLIAWGLAPLVSGAVGTLKSLQLNLWRMFFTFIPLQKAALVAYENIEDTIWGYVRKRLYETGKDRLNDSIEGLLHRKSEMFGKSPPSTKLTRIPATEMSSLKWVEGTNSLEPQCKGHGNHYDDVLVSRKDVKKYCTAHKRVTDELA